MRTQVQSRIRLVSGKIDESSLYRYSRSCVLNYQSRNELTGVSIYCANLFMSQCTSSERCTSRSSSSLSLSYESTTAFPSFLPDFLPSFLPSCLLDSRSLPHTTLPALLPILRRDVLIQTDIPTTHTRFLSLLPHGRRMSRQAVLHQCRQYAQYSIRKGILISSCTTCAQRHIMSESRKYSLFLRARNFSFCLYL